jgi:Cytochrome c3
MNQGFRVSFCALILISISAFALATGEGVQDAAKPPEAADSGPKCLDCHGPYDDLAKATANYTMPSGEVATPHQYVPHDERVEKNIPKCTECHTKHEIPLLDKSTVAKPNNMDYCYQNCHHVNNFQPCSACH